MKSVLKLPQVIKVVSLSRASIYNYVAQGKFPKPIPLGGRSVGWLDSDIEQWIEDRVKESQETEL